MKKITQNSNRYSKVGSNWKISASNRVPPIFLPIGVELQRLKPLILANGIIVKVGLDYLCSLTTLNLIKESNNPHYDIVENGKVKVKDKQVIVGKTVKIIELDISRLEGLANGKKAIGLKAGISDTEYIFEGDRTDGVSNNLITQINYTLTQLGERGVDNFSLYKLKLAPDEAYSIASLQVVEQDDTNNALLDVVKLKVFTESINERLKLLREDFNMIKRMFFNGEIPNNEGKVLNSSQIKDPIQRYSEIIDDNHQVVYKEVGAIQQFRPLPTFTGQTTNG